MIRVGILSELSSEFGHNVQWGTLNSEQHTCVNNVNNSETDYPNCKTT